MPAVAPATLAQPAPRVNVRSADGKTPLIVVDGVISDIDINSIEPSEIESISVLSDAKASSAYGEKGKDGVIEIKMKK